MKMLSECGRRQMCAIEGSLREPMNWAFITAGIDVCEDSVGRDAEMSDW